MKIDSSSLKLALEIYIPPIVRRAAGIYTSVSTVIV